VTGLGEDPTMQCSWMDWKCKGDSMEVLRRKDCTSVSFI
jgi:hypothetical protein